MGNNLGCVQTSKRGDIKERVSGNKVLPKSSSSSTCGGAMMGNFKGLFESNAAGRDDFSAKSEGDHVDDDFFMKLNTMCDKSLFASPLVNKEHSAAENKSPSCEQESLEDLILTDDFNYEDYRSLEKIMDIEERYDIGPTICHGNTSCVKKALHKASNLKCVIKTVKKAKVWCSIDQEQNMKNQLQVLERIKWHAHVNASYELLHDDLNFYIVSDISKDFDMKTYMEYRLDRDLDLFTEKQVRSIAK